MAILGAGLAAVWSVSPTTNVPVGLLTAYLVVTALTAVRPPTETSRLLSVALMLVALAVSLFLVTFGVDALAHGGRKNGMPALPFLVFAAIGLLGTAGDLRVIKRGALAGASRLARHLWRMSAALLIAALSFSVQLPKMLPAPLHIPALLALPPLAVLVTMLYWLWRVRVRRSVRAVIVTSRRANLVTETV
jgi:hypothetical protein